MLFARLLAHIVRAGDLTLIDANGRRYHFGGAPFPLTGGDTGPSPVTIRLRDRGPHLGLVANPELRIGEAYMDGRLVIEDGTLYDFLDIALTNLADDSNSPMWMRWRNGLRRLGRRFRPHNSPSRARANVAHHYDLTETLYAAFLDRDRQYSCAYFPTDAEDLDTAQAAKKRYIAAKLCLRPGMRVLDIGCGWGGLALSLARDYGVDVVGITLSAEQLAVALRRAEGAGVGGQVSFRLADYRDIDGPYDRVVSVGMFEHVGVGHHSSFFATVRRILADDGIALVHTIGRSDGPGATNPWIDRYIFPGGYVPALSEVAAAIEASRLVVTDVDVLHGHYERTLHHWRERFAAHRDRLAALYDERFCRMWEFYLAGAELAFRRQGQVVFQMQICRHHGAVPMTRDYMTLHRPPGAGAAGSEPGAVGARPVSGRRPPPRPGR